jgi:uncharacterized protein (TIGR02444 family)
MSALTPGDPIWNNEPIWTFALDFYGQPGVAEDCLRAQDEYGLIVVALIFALFRSHHDRGFCPADAHSLAASFSATTIEPLRLARRSLKPAPAALLSTQAEGLRTLIKASELEAERLCLLALERLPDENEATSCQKAMSLMVHAAGLRLTPELSSLLNRLAHTAETFAKAG